MDIVAVATVEGFEDVFTSNKVTYVLGNEDDANAEITMKITTSTDNTVEVGREIQYSVAVGTSNAKGVNNASIKCELPEGLKFESGDKNAKYDENTRTITWNFEKLTSESLVIKARVEDLPNGTYANNIPLTLSATCDGSNTTFTSNTYTLMVRKSGYSISQVSSISDGNIQAGDEITYAITVKSIGANSEHITITDILPKELEFVRYTYTRNGNTILVEENDGNSVIITPNIRLGETLNIYVTAKAREVNDSKEITNKVELTSTGVGKIEANTITHTLKGTGGGNSGTNNPSNPETKTYRISGTAWLDENKDGKRDDGEKLLSKVKVYLLNNASRKVVKETQTNDTGAYTFDDVPQGIYLVAFEYDTGKYELTAYQANGVDNSINSDVIKMDLKLTDAKKTYAVTNSISLNNNTYNVDLGLIDDPKFDLELTKGVSLVQVSNSQGTKNYTYDHADIAKVEIPEKYMNGSVIAITYTFRIKNTGAVSGYVNKIVDYKAKDLSFNATLNPEWLQAQDGSIYTSSLTGTEIKPGETAEIALILTKTMTNENTGLSNNLAEIAECSNDLGVSDIDSTPGNKNTSEDDMGSADIIIAIKTGGVLFYGGIVLIVLAIFAFGAYEINKRVLKKV